MRRCTGPVRPLLVMDCVHKGKTGKTQKNAPDHYNPEHPNLLSLIDQRLQQMITICCCHRIHGRYCAVAFSSDGNQGNEPAHW